MSEEERVHRKKRHGTEGTRHRVPIESETEEDAGEAIRAEMESLQEAVEKAKEEAAENYDRLLRVSADFENYKKRVAKEKADLMRYGNEELIRELLPVIDNMERALAHDQTSSNEKGLLEGIRMTLEQFLRILEKFGVTPITAVGEPFDPAKHEAVMEQATDEVEPGCVAVELQRGYILNDRLLRPAKVVVAKAP